MGEHLLPTTTTMNRSKAKREKGEKQDLPRLIGLSITPSAFAYLFMPVWLNWVSS